MLMGGPQFINEFHSKTPLVYDIVLIFKLGLFKNETIIH